MLDARVDITETETLETQVLDLLSRRRRLDTCTSKKNVRILNEIDEEIRPLLVRLRSLGYSSGAIPHFNKVYNDHVV